MAQTVSNKTDPYYYIRGHQSFEASMAQTVSNKTDPYYIRGHQSFEASMVQMIHGLGHGSGPRRPRLGYLGTFIA
jgi:hypothetical protein